jgi:hypothetical protein
MRRIHFLKRAAAYFCANRPQRCGRDEKGRPEGIEDAMSPLVRQH